MTDYSETDIQMLTELAALKEQVKSLSSKIDDIHDAYGKQWKKLDENSREIVRLETRMKVLGGIFVLFGPVVGGAISTMVSKLFQ